MPMVSLPGPVEVDECYIGSRMRGNHGRIPNPSKIIFGIKCRTTGLLLLFPVQNKAQETLFPLIVEHVDSGSQIVSDKAATYVTRGGRSHLEELGFEHYYINHSIEFVDPVQNFIHTNNIERSWRSLRASISHVKRSLSEEKIQSFIDTFQFFNYFTQESLYDVLMQIFVSLK